MSADDQFEDIDDAGVLGVLFGQGNEFLGQVGDEEWIALLGLNELFVDLVGDFKVGEVFPDLDAEFGGALAAAFGGEGEPVGPGGAGDEVIVAGAFPGAGEVDLVGFAADDEAAGDVLRDGGDEFFDQVGHEFKIGESPVGFEHGELGVVLAVDAFVAEVAVYLEDLAHAANQQPLQVKLRCNAQEEVDVEGLVVGGERLGRRAAGDGLHHGRFDFVEAAAFEEVADFAHDLAALEQNLAGVVVDDHVDVTLPVPRFGIG